mmetsp:Transcript_13927/g.29731  ORF Transcript_13927/g.29731 Transcript_13927/m.29731 type:complete len:307 (+) Transcript_13927:800-1720(+)
MTMTRPGVLGIPVDRDPAAVTNTVAGVAKAARDMATTTANERERQRPTTTASSIAASNTSAAKPKNDPPKSSSARSPSGSSLSATTFTISTRRSTPISSPSTGSAAAETVIPSPTSTPPTWTIAECTEHKVPPKWNGCDDNAPARHGRRWGAPRETSIPTPFAPTEGERAEGDRGGPRRTLVATSRPGRDGNAVAIPRGIPVPNACGRDARRWNGIRTIFRIAMRFTRLIWAGPYSIADFRGRRRRMVRRMRRMRRPRHRGVGVPFRGGLWETGYGGMSSRAIRGARPSRMDSMRNLRRWRRRCSK